MQLNNFKEKLHKQNIACKNSSATKVSWATKQQKRDRRRFVHMIKQTYKKTFLSIILKRLSLNQTITSLRNVYRKFFINKVIESQSRELIEQLMRRWLRKNDQGQKDSKRQNRKTRRFNMFEIEIYLKAKLQRQWQNIKQQIKEIHLYHWLES